MRPLIRFSLVVGLLGLLARPPAFAQPEGEASPPETFEQTLEAIRAEYGVPAVAAALVRGEEITAAAVGVRKQGEEDPVTIRDRFHLGSVSKPVTATVIATVVEEGLLSWKTTIAEGLPDLAGSIDPVYLPVTLEQLLSHRAGIIPWEEDEEIAKAPEFPGDAREQRHECTAWLLNQPPVAPPGTEHVYSNAGYTVAVAMTEEAVDEAWEDLVRERLAKPLGMTGLGFGWPAKGRPGQPWGHRAVENGGFTPHPPDDAYQLGPCLAPAGDLHMTIVDLARFARLHLLGLSGKPELLSAETFRRLHKPIGDYGLGWYIRESGDFHVGGAETFVAAIWVSVPRNAAVVMATNADAPDGIISDVINRTLKLFQVPKPE